MQILHLARVPPLKQNGAQVISRLDQDQINTGFPICEHSLNIPKIAICPTITGNELNSKIRKFWDLESLQIWKFYMRIKQKPSLNVLVPFLKYFRKMRFKIVGFESLLNVKCIFNKISYCILFRGVLSIVIVAWKSKRKLRNIHWLLVLEKQI